MGHHCIGFDLEDAGEAFGHFSGQLEIVENYGDRCAGHFLHTWDDGCRILYRCKACGGYVLEQRSEFHSFSDNSSDGYYKDYFPVSGPEEAEELNERYSGFEIEREFEGRYLLRNNLGAPHWSK